MPFLSDQEAGFLHEPNGHPLEQMQEPDLKKDRCDEADGLCRRFSHFQRNHKMQFFLQALPEGFKKYKRPSLRNC